MYVEKAECVSSSVPNDMVIYVRKFNLRILYDCKKDVLIVPGPASQSSHRCVPEV